MTIATIILVVDDDPGIRESLSQELRAAGYATLTAADGREGADLALRKCPDLILTDLALPIADGFALVSAIRATRDTPIDEPWVGYRFIAEPLPGA